MFLFISLIMSLFCIFSFPYWVPQSSLWLAVPQVKYDKLILTALAQCGSVGTLYFLEDSLTPSCLPHITHLM